MRLTTRPPTRRNRLAWLLATKAAIALALGLPATFRRGAAEYRTLAPLAGLAPGAPVTLGGQLIGKVVSMERRGDTTALRVRFVRGAERLPGSRAVRVQRLGFAGTLGLDIRIEDRSRRPRHARSFARGGWLQVLPPAGAGEPFVEGFPEGTPPFRSPYDMPVYPPPTSPAYPRPLPAPTPPTIART
jgi:hypothetical protein